MRKTKTTSILLLIIIIITAVIPLNSYGFVNDYKGHWAESTIQSWLDNNYVTGYPDGSFKPNDPVTRAEFIKMVNNLLGYIETADISFTDATPNNWYYQEVQKAYKAGYLSGISETLFSPNDNLTREQAVVIVSKIMELELNIESRISFTDNNLISDWAKDYVNAAVVSLIILGYSEDNTFRPQSPITRAESIVLLDRINQFIIEDTSIPEGTLTPPSTGGGAGEGGGPIEPVPNTPVVLSWIDPSGNKYEGDEQNITIHISLIKGIDSVKNITLNMAWEKMVDSKWTNVDEEDIILTKGTEFIKMNKEGIFQPVKRITVDNNTSITTVVKFNKVGKYKLTVYGIRE